MSNIGDGRLGVKIEVEKNGASSLRPPEDVSAH